jgi:hypothetical protein
MGRFKMSEKKKVFVLMPFHDPINSYYVTIYKPALEAAGYIVTRADDIYAPRPIMLDIQESILEADLILCEMSGRNPNVFYELGLAHAVGKPVILVSNKESDIPFDLKHVRAILYDLAQENWKSRLQTEITVFAQAVAASNKRWPPPLIELKRKSLPDYGVKILSPTHGEIRYGRFEVRGSFESKPPESALWLFITSPDGIEHWPQEVIQVDVESKGWKGFAALYERPSREARIVVASVGESGQILCDYYRRVGHETSSYPPLLKLPSDIVKLDEVKVYKVAP